MGLSPVPLSTVWDGTAAQLGWGLEGSCQEWEWWARERAVKHSEEMKRRLQEAVLAIYCNRCGPLTRSALHRRSHSLPHPWLQGSAAGVNYTGIQWCFRSLEVFSQGTTRISKSQRSFCRQSMGREAGVSLGPGLPPPNSQPRPTMRGSHWFKGQVKWQRQTPGLSSQLALWGSPSLLSALGHLDLGLSHRRLGEAQSGRPDQFKLANLRVWGCGDVTSSCAPAARGQVVRSMRSPVTALFRQAVLPISTVR